MHFLESFYDYIAESEVVRAALRLMEEQQQRQALQLEMLKVEIAAAW